jgi:ribonuclease HII
MTNPACYYSRDMAAGTRLQPSLAEEEALWAFGRSLVAGVDEVGRGPMAGPIFAAAVILEPGKRPEWLADVRDSKMILAPERERLAALIQAGALSYGIGWASVAEINGWGIFPANKVAMERALAALRVRPHFVLIDGPSRITTPYAQKTIVDGDALCMSIAAASIVAKVARDRLMCELDRLYPGYGFASHKGYTTREHLEKLAQLGPCDQHRWAYLPVREAADRVLAGITTGGERLAT